MTRRVATAAAALAALAGAWTFMWPAQFGGHASWLVVDGAQLEPSYADGDLVIAREHSTYADTALVAADAGDGPVLGLAGDVEGEILGRPWLHLAGAGDAMTVSLAVVLSWPFLVLVGLASVALMLIGRRRNSRANETAAASADRSRATHTLAS